MTFFSAHPRTRWLAPGVALALTVGAFGLTQTSAGASTGLPPRTAQELLVAVQQATPPPMSGVVEQRVDLGLPELPAGLAGGASASGGLDLTTLLSGSHTWRVWYADDTHARLALVQGSAETDIVVNGTDVWQWSSADQSARHSTLTAPADKGTGPSTPQDLPAQLATPEGVAQSILQAIDPTTAVTVTTTDDVAGRPAYGLVLTPRAAGTLVGSVHLSVDAATSVPLAVSVLPRGSSAPALDVRFSRFDEGAPPASTFQFTPPPGATVTSPGDGSAGASGDGSATAPDSPTAPDSTGGPNGPQSPNDLEKPVVHGSGWTTVVTGRVPVDSGQADPAAPGAGLLGFLQSLPTTSGSWGSGHVLSTRLFTVVVTDDGRYAAGLVDADTLGAALAGTS